VSGGEVRGMGEFTQVSPPGLDPGVHLSSHDTFCREDGLPSHERVHARLPTLCPAMPGSDDPAQGQGRARSSLRAALIGAISEPSPLAPFV
jgi:hypothetical protein